MSVFGHPKAEIFFTTDGSNPRLSGTKYLNPFTVLPETTLRAYASETGFEDSLETVAYYPYSAPSSPQITVTNANNMDEYPKEVLITAATSVFLRGSSGWKYAKGTVNQSSSWVTLGFDDSMWLVGSCPFWYDDSVTRAGTHLTDMQENYTTVYLRKKFTVSNPSMVTRLRFDFSIDDGYIVWVNGVEVNRYNAPVGAFPANNTVAPASARLSSRVVEVSSPGLNVGDNVVAVMLFNRSLSSSDVWLDLDFKVYTIAPQTYVIFNGSSPELVTGPKTITGPGTLTAYVVGSNGNVGQPVSQTFTQQLPCVEFATIALNHTAPTAVYMSVPGFDPADIFYTVNGTTPTSNSLKYNAEFPPFFTAQADIRAFASKDGYVDSPVTRWKLPAGDETYVVGLVGDQGDGSVAEPRPYIQVAEMLRGKNPNFIFGVGDNTYTTGLPASEIIQMDILDGYRTEVNAKTFLTAWGNHDWYPEGGGGDGASLPELLKVFNYQPGNKRYFDLVVGQAHFFFLSTFTPEPDIVTSDAVSAYNSKQGQWFKAKANASTRPWKIVLLHHVPYTSESNYRPGITYMRWPFENHGIDMVFCGHMHAYERLIGEDGVYYFGIGHGGKGPLNHGLVWTPPGLTIGGGDGATTQVFNMTSYGALVLRYSAHQMLVEAFAANGSLMDSLTLQK